MKWISFLVHLSSGGGSHSEQGVIQIVRTYLYVENYIPMEGQYNYTSQVALFVAFASKSVSHI